MPADSRVPGDAAHHAETIAAYLKGDARAGDALAEVLAGPVRLAVRSFLGDESPDVDDVVQETTVAVLEFLRRNGGFAGNLVRFAVTIARNRCRNILNWRRRLPHVPIEPLQDWLRRPEASPLEILAEREVLAILQEVLDDLSPDCRLILRAYYLQDVPVESLRRRLGLKTVQGVYYRKTACLREAARRLKKRLAVCSGPDAGDGVAGEEP